MSHLSPERLAALADEDPAAPALAHLIACPVCTAERDAQRALQSMALAERASIGLPLTRWESISAELHDAGMITSGDPAPHRMPGRGRRFLLQAAAALLFVAGGTVLGRYTVGATPLPGIGPYAAQNADTGDSLANPGVKFQNVDQALSARARAQAVYQDASAFLAQHDTGASGSESPSAMRTRLAALDRVSHAMREALNSAPYDPVINDYYLTTLGQREATLRQLNTVLPAGLRVNSF
jgi:hypothetical protein